MRSYQLFPPRMTVFMPLLDAHSSLQASHLWEPSGFCWIAPRSSSTAGPPFSPASDPTLKAIRTHRHLDRHKCTGDSSHLGRGETATQVRPRIATLFVNRSHRIDQALPSNHSDHRLLYRDDSAANRRPSCNTKKENPTNLLHSCAYITPTRQLPFQHPTPNAA